MVQRNHLAKFFRQIINSDGCLHAVLSLHSETFFQAAASEAAYQEVTDDCDQYQD
jgi:hypothetical protein